MTYNIYKPREDCQIPVLADIYQQYFGQKIDGMFIEIGAWDCVSYSNTIFLAELGWRGVYVDPIPEMLLKGMQEYDGKGIVSFVKTAVGAKREQRLFKHNTDAPWLYTGNEKFGTVNCVNEDYGMVQVITLDEIMEKFGQVGLDLLIIDVEGMELEVLEGFNCRYWLPYMVIIETHETHPNSDMRANAPAIDEYFLSRKYKKIWTSAINTIYVSE